MLHAPGGKQSFRLSELLSWCSAYRSLSLPPSPSLPSEDMERAEGQMEAVRNALLEVQQEQAYFKARDQRRKKSEWGGGGRGGTGMEGLGLWDEKGVSK